MNRTNEQFTYCVGCQEIRCFETPCRQPHCQEACNKLLNHQELVKEIICRECLKKYLIPKKKGNGHAD